MYLIGSSTPSGAGGTISFTNIPQTYKHLKLLVYLRTTYTGSENMFMRFNNASYSYIGHIMTGNGSSFASSGYSTASNVSYVDSPAAANGSQATNTFSGMIIDIYDYASTTKTKTIRMLGGFDNSGIGYIQLMDAIVPTTSAITDIHQIGGTATVGFVAGTRFDLYGIPNTPVTGA
jgi:hypothetical protein